MIASERLKVTIPSRSRPCAILGSPRGIADARTPKPRAARRPTGGTPGAGARAPARRRGVDRGVIIIAAIKLTGALILTIAGLGALHLV